MNEEFIAPEWDARLRPRTIKPKKPYVPAVEDWSSLRRKECNDITLPDDCVFMAECPSCDWFGDRADCNEGGCPNCGRRVRKAKQGKE